MTRNGIEPDLGKGLFVVHGVLNYYFSSSRNTERFRALCEKSKPIVRAKLWNIVSVNSAICELYTELAAYLVIEKRGFRVVDPLTGQEFNGISEITIRGWVEHE